LRVSPKPPGGSPREVPDGGLDCGASTKAGRTACSAGSAHTVAPREPHSCVSLSSPVVSPPFR